MKSRTIAQSASALLALAASVSANKHDASHERLHALHKKHHAHREAHKSAMERGEGVELRSTEKRGGQCVFPTDAGLVPVTPDQQNAGWAMSPNQPCTPGTYCPYACPPGQVSMQWDPDATSYTYPQSMNGGLYCDENGNMQMPFPSKPYCQDATTTIGATNNAGGTVAFCQTVLPGNEAMLIPTQVDSWAQLAVPDPSYWCGTAAHYYINPPGTSVEEACVWGTSANPVGNWSPYVAGANTDNNGNTFVKLGWNPIYLEPATPFRNTMPNWGVEIQCNGEGCNGLPCAIDPSQNGVNEMVGSSTDGAGGGAFCVVTVPKGVSANFVITGAGGSSSSAQGGQFYQSSAWSGSSESSTASSGWSSSSEATTTWSQWPASATYPANNTHHHWEPPSSASYSISNNTATAAPAPAAGSSEAALTATYTAPSGPATLPATGAASTKEVSITIAVLAALAALSF